MLRDHDDPGRRSAGFTFIEVVFSTVILGTAIVALSSVLSRDLLTTTGTRWDQVGQAAANRLAEYYSKFLGWNALSTMQPQSPITDTSPPLPELQEVPSVTARLWITDYQGNPEVKQLTVAVDVAHGRTPAGAPTKIRTWRASTLVAKYGFDESG